MQQNLERKHAMTFRVTEKERDMIKKRQEQSGIQNMRAYLLKQAIDGRIIHIELDSVNEMCRLLGNVSNNINQIARRVNETSNIHRPDIEDIQARQEEIWIQQKEILRRLNNIMDNKYNIFHSKFPKMFLSFGGQPNFGLSSNALKIEGIFVWLNFALNPILVSINAPNFGFIEDAPFWRSPQF